MGESSRHVELRVSPRHAAREHRTSRDKLMGSRAVLAALSLSRVHAWGAVPAIARAQRMRGWKGESATRVGEACLEYRTGTRAAFISV